MAGTIATRIAVLDAIKKLQAQKTPWPKIVKHLNKNGLHPGNRRRWTYSSVFAYWTKYKYLIEQKTKRQALRASEHIEALRKNYPRHQILSHEEVVQQINQRRTAGAGWRDVAKALNKQKILHEDWRGRTSKWNKDSVRVYHKRNEALLDSKTERLPMISSYELPAPSNNESRRKLEVNFQEITPDHQITGNVQMGSEETVSTVRFTYEGTLTTATYEYLRSFQLLP